MRFIIKPAKTFSEKQEENKLQFDKEFLSKILKVLKDNLITQYDVSYYEDGTLAIYFYDYETILKAHLSLEIADIHHSYYQENAASQSDFISFIEIEKREKPYDKYLMSKKYLSFLAFRLGKRLMEFYDRCYIEKKIVLSKPELRQINRDIEFMLNVKVEETSTRLPITSLYDYYFTAGSTPKEFFKSDKINEEELKYGIFTNLLLNGKCFEKAFIRSFNKKQ